VKLLLLLWAAWAAAADVKNPDTLTSLVVGEATSLDPAFPYDNTSQGLIYNVYETLIAFDGPRLDAFVPRLATEVPTLKNRRISKDGLTYRFTIRKGVKFHDGSSMTPEDVKYSLLRFMVQDRAGGPSGLLLEPIAGSPSTRDAAGKITLDYEALEKAITVKGDDVTIKLPRPFGPFLSIMARWSYVMPKAWGAAHGDWDGSSTTWRSFNNPEKTASYFYEHMNGTGPFWLERWDRTAKYVLLSRNHGYWREPAALRRVMIKAVPELSTRKLQLQAGDADIVEVPRPYASQFQNLPGATLLDGLTRLQTDPAIFFTFKVNGAGNPDIGSGQLDGEGIPPDFFDDPEVRKGFSYAFDYEAILRDTFKGTAQRAKGPAPMGLAGYDPDQPFYTYNPAKAEAHLRKAWRGTAWEKGFRFTMTYNTGSENREAACQILKKGIESLNPKFRIDLRGVDWAAFLDKTQKHLMPVFSRGWSGDYPDIHNFIYAFYHSAGRYPSAQGYSNPALDKLIEQAASEADPKKRAALYKQALKLGHEDAPAIFTVHPRGLIAVRDWVKDFYDNPVFLDVYFYPISKR
jgi:peptide/nickel transport system substrate-binding protein